MPAAFFPLYIFSGPEVLFKTCIAMKFVDDDDDDDDKSALAYWLTLSYSAMHGQEGTIQLFAAAKFHKWNGILLLMHR